MTARPDALRYAFAALTLVALVALAARVYGQLNDLAAARGDLADAARTAAELRSTAMAGIGPPLLDARLAAPTDLLAQRLKGLRIEVRRTTLVAAKPAGQGAVVARFAVQGGADPAALDRLALWAHANARATILETLSATAAASGKSDVTLELDAIVRQAEARRS
jgi:hypothetical protein